MTDSAHADRARVAALADQMFAAIERGDVAAVADTWSEDIAVWRQGGGRERDKARALKVIAWFIGATAQRRYELLDRQIFDGGFVQQHVVHATATKGTPLSFRAALVAKVGPGGQVTRIDEYLDPADLGALSD